MTRRRKWLHFYSFCDPCCDIFCKTAVPYLIADICENKWTLAYIHFLKWQMDRANSTEQPETTLRITSLETTCLCFSYMYIHAFLFCIMLNVEEMDLLTWWTLSCLCRLEVLKKNTQTSGKPLQNRSARGKNRVRSRSKGIAYIRSRLKSEA